MDGEPAKRFNSLLLRLDDSARDAVQNGLGEAVRLGIFLYDVEFLLMGLSRVNCNGLWELLNIIQLEPTEFRGLLRGLLSFHTKGWRAVKDVSALGARALQDVQEGTPEIMSGSVDLNRPIVAPFLLSILEYADTISAGALITSDHLLLSAMQHPSFAVEALGQLLLKQGYEPEEFINRLAFLTGVELGTSTESQEREVSIPNKEPRKLNAGSLLAKLGRDLTDLALADKIGPAVGEHAHKAMLQIGRILQQKESNNPILLGDPGVGKTAIVEGFAYRLARENNIFPALKRMMIIDLSATSLLAGVGDRGELEQRLQKLLKEVSASNGQIVLFIDEVHSFFRNEGIGEVLANAFKPALARGELPLIGATTVSEYRRYIESDAALTRRLSSIWVDEPSAEDAIQIARAIVKNRLSPHHQVEYPEEVIEESVNLSMRYIHDEFLPGKAVKILDQAGPRVRMGQSLRGPMLGQRPSLSGPVTVDVIRAIVSDRTGIPLTQIIQSDKERLQKLEVRLQDRVRGQDTAIRSLAQVIKRGRVGLADPHRPLGVFMFAGPSGVGKTELALALAEALFDSEEALFRLDMSEFMERFQLSRLTGSPPGYVGYEEEHGQLTGRLRRYPYSVILLDEMEKAHVDVQNLFLQLFDAGRISDARGNLADGRNAIFIMTTNLGARDALDQDNRSAYERQMLNAIESHFHAEFLGRVNKVICFNPLNEELLLVIFDKFFAQVAKRFFLQNIEINITQAYKHEICNKYMDATMGARTLLHGIEEEIVAPLTDKLISGEIHGGMKLTLDRKGKITSLI